MSIKKLTYFWIVFYVCLSLIGQAVQGYTIYRRAEPGLSIITDKIVWKSESRLWIQNSPGGVVPAFKFAIDLMYWTNHGVIISGGCYSACTMFTVLKDFNKSCAEDGAILYFHKPFSIVNGEKVPASDWYTNNFIKYYPLEVQEWIKEQGGLPVDGWISAPATKWFKACTEMN